MSITFYFRNNTIQKWYDKTRLSGGKVKSKSFSNFEQSALKQIEQVIVKEMYHQEMMSP
jgi:hypothetical protein